MSVNLSLQRRLALQQRAELAEVQYAIEATEDELGALYRRRQYVAEALALTEEYIKTKTETGE